MSKIQIFESNSQQLSGFGFSRKYCLRCQRYKFLKAIHNWKSLFNSSFWLFTMSKIQIFESNSQLQKLQSVVLRTVYDVKDTNFWKQFTTINYSSSRLLTLFTMSKIQIFESNSQLFIVVPKISPNCLRCQRYKFLKAIHNTVICANVGDKEVWYLSFIYKVCWKIY